MNEARNRTPAHLWIVGILATLLNAFFAYDYLMTRLRNTGRVVRTCGTTLAIAATGVFGSLLSCAWAAAGAANRIAATSRATDVIQSLPVLSGAPCRAGEAMQQRLDER